MHLFSPERPTATNDRPMLVDGRHIVPIIYVFPREKGFALEVMLRVHDSRGGYAYRYCDVESAEALGKFFEAYRQDPEATLLEYFNWELGVATEPQEPEEPDVPGSVSGADFI